MSISEGATRAAVEHYRRGGVEEASMLLLVAILDELQHDVDCEEHMRELVYMAGPPRRQEGRPSRLEPDPTRCQVCGDRFSSGFSVTATTRNGGFQHFPDCPPGAEKSALCDRCLGSGWNNGGFCPLCEGTGRFPPRGVRRLRGSERGIDREGELDDNEV